MPDRSTETMVAPLTRGFIENSKGILVRIYPVGSTLGSRHTIGDEPVLIGRSPDCDISVTDASVSRNHARIERTLGSLIVTDLNSTNGTYVNDEPVREGTPLRDGDYLRIGNCIFRYLSGGNVEAAYHEEIYRLTIIDALTQAHNRRAFAEFLDRELIRSERHGRPLSLLLMDVDYFKKINDTYGHTAGDLALRELAELIRGGVRREDMLARYGGEELALLLIEAALPQAVEVAERIRKQVENHLFRHGKVEFRMTVSIGVAATPGGELLTTTEMIRRADENLYKAKNSGRNCVVS